MERLKTQIHAALALVVHTMNVSPVTLKELNWDARKWKLPLDPGTSTDILPQIKELKIRKSCTPSYQWKTQAELFSMGETSLDKMFAQRLQVKRESIGMFAMILKLCLTLYAMFLRLDIPRTAWKGQREADRFCAFLIVIRRVYISSAADLLKKSGKSRRSLG